MEFAISRNNLLRALQRTRTVISGNRNAMFKDFVFTFEESTMDINTTNGCVWMKETVTLEEPAKDPRPISVWYGDLLRSIKSLDEQILRFDVGEYQMTVTHDCGKFRLPLTNVASQFIEHYKPCPDADAEDGVSFNYEAPGLRSILSQCKFAMANDDLRPTMNGVYMNFTDQFADYVSSDGHKLIRVRKAPMFSNKFVSLSIILPANIVNTLLRILPTTGDVRFEYQKELIVEKERMGWYNEVEKYMDTERKPAARVIIDNNITLTFETIEGRYPAYWNVIPNTCHFEMTIDRRALVKSVDRLSIFQSACGMVEIDVTDTVCRLKTEDSDFDTCGDENIPCECRMSDGSDTLPTSLIHIGLKTSSLAATLKTLSSEKVVVRFIDESRAVVIVPQHQPDVEEITMLLMPMLLNN